LVASQDSIYTNYPDFWPSVYRVDVTTGKQRLEVKGRTNFMDWGADHLSQVRLGLSYDDNTMTSRLLYRKDGKGSFQQLDKASHRRNETLNVPFLFLAGGNKALVMRDNEEGRTEIDEVDLAAPDDGKTIFTPAKGEVEGAITSDDGRLLGAYTTDPDNPIIWIDPDLTALQGSFRPWTHNGAV
jgi:hypothetical protein